MAEETTDEVTDITDRTVELGGNISLTGFGDLDWASMIVLKKVVGTYAKKFSEICKKFERLSLVMKPVHKQEKSEKYEIHAKVIDNGKIYAADMTDRNLFFVLDSVLKKIENEIS